jgi:hypothetical protein
MTVGPKPSSDSLTTTVAEVLADFQVPVPTPIVRVVTSERRGETVKAERLSRLAAAQREKYLRDRLPPVLCNAIDTNGIPLTPRVWARGEWTLSLRITTPDVHDDWRTAWAIALCDEMIYRFPRASEQLARTTLEAVARSLGPRARYLPGSTEPWQSFRDELAKRLPGPGLKSPTRQQQEAARALEEHQPPIPSAELYFGVTSGAITAPMLEQPKSLRLPVTGESSTPFDRVVARRLAGNESRMRDLLAYLQGWAHLYDDLGRAPTSGEFADHWHFDIASVHSDEQLFAAAFPEEESPEAIIRLLNEGLPRSGQLVWMMGIPVVEIDPSPTPRPPAPGQRWRARDKQLTITEVNGDQVIAGLHHRETTSLWVGSVAELNKHFTLDLPQDMWHVRFVVDRLPTDFNDPLVRNDIAPTRFARPADPEAGKTSLAAGVVEAQLAASSAAEAKSKVIEAVKGLQVLRPTEIKVKHLRSRPSDDA